MNSSILKAAKSAFRKNIEALWADCRKSKECSMGNAKAKRLVAVAKECRNELGISGRIIENLRLVARHSSFLEEGNRLEMKQANIIRICHMQKIIPETLEEYISSFNNAFLFLGGRKDLECRISDVGDISTRCLLLACLVRLNIRSHSGLNRFWKTSRGSFAAMRTNMLQNKMVFMAAGKR